MLNRNVCNKDIVLDYINGVDNDTDTQEDWFNNLKEFAVENNYSADKKAYKAEPDKFNGVVDRSLCSSSYHHL